GAAAIAQAVVTGACMARGSVRSSGRRRDPPLRVCGRGLNCQTVVTGERVAPGNVRTGVNRAQPGKVGAAGAGIGTPAGPGKPGPYDGGVVVKGPLPIDS